MELIEKLYDSNIFTIAIIVTVGCGIAYGIWATRMLNDVNKDDEAENSPY